MLCVSPNNLKWNGLNIIKIKNYFELTDLGELRKTVTFSENILTIQKRWAGAQASDAVHQCSTLSQSCLSYCSYLNAESTWLLFKYKLHEAKIYAFYFHFLFQH